MMFEKYDAYKDSALPSFGNVPKHWDIVPLCSITTLKSITNVGNEELLSVYLDKGVIRFDDVTEKRTNVTSLDLSKYQLVEEGDFVLNNQQAWRGSVGVSIYRGIISPAYLVLKLSPKVDAKFANYFFRNSAMVSQYLINSKGVGTIQRNLYWQHLKRSDVVLPPTEEQIEIAEFLDQKTFEIDQAIAIKEQQIALLNERKQIVIQKAVTQGLDSNVAMKDSGVEWIGEIPEHWEIRANRTMFKERNEQGKEGLPLLSVSIHSGVSNEEISEEDNVRGRVKIEDKSKYILVKKGDIAFNMMRAWQGGIGAVSVDGMVSPAYIVAKPNDFINSEFFEYQYRCPEFIQQMDRYSKGITDFRKRLYWDGFKQLLTVVPPIDEQLKIVEQIKAIEQQTNVATQIKNQQIEKLKEYKATLINDAVTGKIKVA
ncbi:restriction endonuclease subunit S [Acinetobacter sp. neg1]|uniref:restriction endonuclease subunit S n=1 Tax=Acinetobacter sp. neg1 TaxID=1561068 RepID=UPI000647767D|nr:restriction endonuclease subunit S [Acinetobacter sp. neg1]